MPILRKANTEPQQIPLDDEGSYISVTTDVTKGQFNALVEAMPQDVDDEKGLTPSQGTGLQTALFKTFVIGWSLDAEPTVEEYLGLPREAADAIDEALMTHFSKIQVGESDRKKPKR